LNGKSRFELAGAWELTPEDLAEIFERKDWGMDLGGTLRAPRPDEIETIYEMLYEDVVGSDGAPFSVQRGRFMAYRDPEAPGSISVFLQVGFAWDPSLLSEEEKERLEGVTID
jgi:hypothetical protein